MSDWPWDIRCRIGTAPGLVPAAWEDVTTRLRRDVTVRYGRQDELGGGDLGEAVLSLDNRDGRWNPGIAPHTAVKLEVTVDAVTRPLWYGIVQSAPAVWTNRSDATVEVTAVDGISLLARQDATVELGGHLSGTRVLALLNAAGWPAGFRDVDPGVVLVNELTSEEGAAHVNVLSALEDAVEAEQGQMWIAPDGKLTFRDRHSRLNQTAAATFGSTHPMFDLSPVYDDLRLFTVGRAEMADGETIEFSDDAAVAAYGRRVFEVRDLDVSLVEAEAVTAWTVQRYGQPRLRFSRIEVEGRVNNTLAALMLTLQPNMVVRAIHTPEVGNSVDELVHIEHVEHRIGRGSWRAVFELSPYFGAGPWFRLDDSLLDSTAGLAP